MLIRISTATASAVRTRLNSKLVRRIAAVITSILALTLVCGVPAAFADGDPASDVLSAYSLFDPPDAGVPAATEQRLEALLSASARAGFPIRVALINSASDLGTVTQFWGQRPGVRAGNY